MQAFFLTLQADFPLLFDTAIADALVFGPLRTEAVVLTEETLRKIKANNVNAKTERLMITLAEYYIANKEPDSDWVIIPRTNISAYLGSATYMETYESRIHEGYPKDLWKRSLRWAVSQR